MCTRVCVWVGGCVWVRACVCSCVRASIGVYTQTRTRSGVLHDSVTSRGSASVCVNECLIQGREVGCSNEHGIELGDSQRTR
jgi:hypothetical protein